MAITRTNFGPFVHNTSGFVAAPEPYVSPSFDTVSGSLLVVKVVATSNDETINPDDITVTASGGVELTKRRQASNGLAADYSLVQIWAGPVVTGAPTTITVDHSLDFVYAVDVHPACLEGYDPADPIGGTAAGLTTGALTLDEAPGELDYIEAIINVLSATENATDVAIAPGTGFTETGEGAPSQGLHRSQAQFRTGTTDTGVSWTVTGSPLQPAAAAIVIRAFVEEPEPEPTQRRKPKGGIGKKRPIQHSPRTRIVQKAPAPVPDVVAEETELPGRKGPLQHPAFDPEPLPDLEKLAAKLPVDAEAIAEVEEIAYTEKRGDPRETPAQPLSPVAVATEQFARDYDDDEELILMAVAIMALLSV